MGEKARRLAGTWRLAPRVAFIVITFLVMTVGGVLANGNLAAPQIAVSHDQRSSDQTGYGGDECENGASRTISHNGEDVKECTEDLKEGQKVKSPKGDIELDAPQHLDKTLIVNFLSPANAGDPTQFTLVAPLVLGKGGPELKIDPPVVVTTLDGFILYVFDAASRTFRAETGNLVTHPGLFKVDVVSPFHFSPDQAASALATGNDPKTIGSGKTIRLYASTYPGATVTITVFGQSQTGTADAGGEVQFNFTAPAVTAPTIVYYKVHAVRDRGNGKLTNLYAVERFRVVP